MFLKTTAITDKLQTLGFYYIGKSSVNHKNFSPANLVKTGSVELYHFSAQSHI